MPDAQITTHQGIWTDGIIEVERPFERVGVDLLGPFPLSRAGNRHIIVAVDYLTKWVETEALPTGTAEDVAKFLVNFFYRHGAAESIITDRGKSFIAEMVQRLLLLLSSNNTTTTAYHSQTNGLCERQNHTLADMLSMFVNANHDNWDELLPAITFAYNSSRQESSRLSPFYLMHGTEALIPMDVALGVDPKPPF